MNEGDYVTKLPCNHVYEPEAILKWLKTEKTECPSCRYKLESTEVKVNNVQMFTEASSVISQAEQLRNYIQSLISIDRRVLVM